MQICQLCDAYTLPTLLAAACNWLRLYNITLIVTQRLHLWQMATVGVISHDKPNALLLCVKY